MKRRTVRHLAVALLALYALGQAALAIAACDSDRAAMAHAMAMSADDTPCDRCGNNTPDESVSVACSGHCTADVPIFSVAKLPFAATAPAQPAARPRERYFEASHCAVRAPPAALPRRILLHSFQI